jgi:CRP-like cAMP-binding protein
MPIPKTTDSPKNNRILAALPAAELEKLEPVLERVELERGSILWETDEKGEYLFFPTTSLVSLLYENESGISVSIATIGRSGVAGTGMVVGNIETPDRAIVTCGGGAYRMKASLVKEELADCGDFHTILLNYTNSLMIHISQNAICNRLHRIDQQFCRWLLDCRDELQTDSLSITHDQIASILGVRRESVSLAASQFHKTKLIRSGRGKVRILDPEQMANAACECYSVVKERLDQSLKAYAREHRS